MYLLNLISKNGICLLLILSFLCSGCSQNVLQPQNSTTVDIIPSSTPVTQTLNKKLGDIQDLTSAEDAVDFFFNYVDTRIDTSSSTPSLSSSRSITSPTMTFSNLINTQKLARLEYQCRQPGIKIQSIGASVTLESLTDELNRTAHDPTYDISVEAVKTVRDAVRKSMPNLSPNQATTMTPLEARIISWVIITGDDGSAKEGAYQLNIPLSDIIEKQNATIAVQELLAGILIVGFLWYVAPKIEDWINKKIHCDKYGNPISVTQIQKIKQGKKTITKKRILEYYHAQNLGPHIQKIASSVVFENTSPPHSFLAGILPSQPSQTYSGISVASASLFGLKAFPWNIIKNSLLKGDIVFSRGLGVTPYTVSLISSWTHTGMVYNTNRNESFESLLAGVNLYNPLSTWKKARSWAVRRVPEQDLNRVAIAVEEARQRWAPERPSDPIIMPYFPPMLKLTTPPHEFLNEWLDKDELNSMYCFKLVYNTYLLAGIDLDSNRTRFSEKAPQVESLYEHDFDDNNRLRERCFIGVTGDDIYYSKHLDSKDIYSYRLDNLKKPLPIDDV